MLYLNFNKFPVINTDRLLLRQVDKTDVNEIFFLRSDKKIMKYLDKAPAKDLDDAYKFIQIISDEVKDNASVTWAITLKGNSKVAGTICFWNIQKEHDRAELGYILHPEYWRKGLMQEAITSVIKYGFEVIKLHSVEAHVNPNNIPSIKLLEKNGFIREAYFRENYFYNGKFLDTAIYSLLTTSKD